MKIVTVVGARPQFIKAAAVSKCFLQDKGIEEIIVHTGQHFDSNMSNVFFDEMGIPEPKYNLGINGGSHASMTAGIMCGLEEVFVKESPDYVLVYGDTNSTLAAALTAAKMDIKIAHIESGLRSYVMSMPEEINRVLTDNVSKILFCPTQDSVANLEKEGIKNVQGSSIVVENVGDVMYDAFKMMEEHRDESILEELALKPNEYILATVHRAVNTDSKEALVEILEMLKLASKHSQMVLQVHPRFRNRIKSFDLEIPEGFVLVDPVPYTKMSALLVNAKVLMTDSGGMQKESVWAQTPCVTMREETEWVETLVGGFNVLVGRDVNKLKIALENIQKIDFSSLEYENLLDSYGCALASDKIMKVLHANVSC